jgi:hypothetical protein
VLAASERAYRRWFGLDAPEAQVGPAISLELGRAWRPRRLGDGTRIRRGDRVGLIHLNNRRVAALHVEAPDARAAALAFRRLFVASLGALAARAVDEGPLAHVRAFAATTIFTGLERVGFEPEPPRMGLGLVAGYQRALLAALHPAAGARLASGRRTRARRWWISRERLLALHGPWPRQPRPSSRTSPSTSRSGSRPRSVR